jgi:ubiquinone/menaquinone biosynthesis C-methylase UbiE
VREYDLIAEWYASERVSQAGVPEVLAVASSLRAGSLLLDIGCGNGVPLTRTLAAAGHRIVGLDTSSSMLARFRRNVPHSPAARGTVECCPFRDGTFDGAIAWGVLFHLPQPSQIDAIASVARVLKPDAPFLFTAGDVNGARPCTGKMNGVEFNYYSFTVEAYRGILADHAMSLIDFHVDEGDNRYYLARKSPAA